MSHRLLGTGSSPTNVKPSLLTNLMHYLSFPDRNSSALVNVITEDVNEFSPEFESHFYSVSLDWEPNSNKDKHEQQQHEQEEILLDVRARDQDCSSEFGSVCRYELLPLQPEQDTSKQQQQQQPEPSFSIDTFGRIRMRYNSRWVVSSAMLTTRQRQVAESLQEQTQGMRQLVRNFQVIAYDCAGKKSLVPATVQVNLNKLCRPTLKGKRALSLSLFPLLFLLCDFTSFSSSTDESI